MTPGFHALPAEQYHADRLTDSPSLSNSIAQILLRESPRKAWFSHPRLNPDYREEHEDKFDMGTACHAMLLENNPAALVVVEANDWRKKEAQEQRDSARAAGKTPILARHFAAVQKMVNAATTFLAQSEISEYWFDAESEVTGLCQERGVWLRCRYDKITKDRRVQIDYKSTVDASPDGFSRQLVRMGYHLQDSFYRRISRILGVPKPEFVFVAQSVEPPYECSLHACDPALQQIADAEVERAIGIWRDCMTRKEWPSYDKRIHWAMPTTWMIQDHESRMQEAA